MEGSSSNIKVSVVIPTYKRTEDVSKAVESVCKQTLKDIEIIVVDDNSPESIERAETRRKIEAICQRDERVIYIEHPRNMNGSAARNTGIKRANGEVISFLDDDDCYLPEKLEKQYNLLSTLSPKYAGIISDCYIIRNGSVVKTLSVDKQENALKEVLACTYNMGSGSNLFIRRSVVNELNGFDELLLRHQDYDFLVRLFLKYDVLKISEPLFSIEQRSIHLNTPNVKRMEDAKLIYLEKYKTIIEGISKEDQDNIYSSQYMSLCETAVRGKLFSVAKQFYKKAKSYQKVKLKQNVRLVLLGGYAMTPNAIKRHLLLGK